MKEREISDKMVFESRFLSVIFFICSIMVVGIHSYYVPADKADTITSYIESFLCHGVFMAAVPIFFFLSGHLFFRNIKNTGDVFKKMKTRTKSVLMPFLAWSTFYLIFISLASFTPFFTSNDVSFHPLDILKGIVFYKYCFPLWYMYQLIMFVILTPLIHKLIKNKYVGLGVLAILAIISVFITDSIDIAIFENDSRALFQFNFFCYYFSGCLSVQFSDALLKAKAYVEKKRKPIFAISAVVLVASAFLQSLLFEERIPFFYKRIFEPFVAISLFIFVYTIYERIPYIKQASTMIVYGVHPIIGSLIRNLFGSYMWQLPLLLAFTIDFVIVAVLSFLFAYLLKRFIKPVHFVFSGGR